IVLAFAVAVLAAAVLRTSAHGRAPVAIETVLDIPPIPRDVARALTFGFRSLLADCTLLQAIQVLPSRHGDMTPGLAAPIDRRLFRLLAYSVEVDPKLSGAYRHAAPALPHDRRERGGDAQGVAGPRRRASHGTRPARDRGSSAALPRGEGRVAALGACAGRGRLPSGGTARASRRTLRPGG